MKHLQKRRAFSEDGGKTPTEKGPDIKVPKQALSRDQLEQIRMAYEATEIVRGLLL